MKVDYGRLQALLYRIELALPKGYRVTLLARHRTNPNAHLMLGDDDIPEIRRTLEALELPDVKMLPAGERGQIHE